MLWRNVLLPSCKCDIHEKKKNDVRPTNEPFKRLQKHEQNVESNFTLFIKTLSNKFYFILTQLNYQNDIAKKFKKQTFDEKRDSKRHSSKCYNISIINQMGVHRRS